MPGLRREEVASLAGVSADYYRRLERGQVSGVSELVLEALARALQLDDAERAHLFDLARAASPVAPKRSRPPKTRVRPVVQRLLDQIEAPAIVSSVHGDYLAANALGRALYAPVFESPEQPANSGRFTFLDPAAREFYPDWERLASELVAALRSQAGRNPYDRNLQDLIGELSTRSDEFRVRWAAHNVRFHRTGTKRLHHPIVGELELSYETLTLDADDGLRLALYTAEAGSASQQALDLLASWTATPSRPGAAPRRTRGPRTMTPATTPALTLNNGVTMPALGLGVFQSPPEETITAVETALRDGYRLIDTAAAYDNEREVGEGIRRSGVDRDEIFVTTKLWISDYGYDAAQVGFDASLRRLGVDHVDLYLLHQPVPTHFEDTIGAYKAAETFLADGRARAIGVSNFSAEHLRDLIDRTDVVPGGQPGRAAPVLHAARAARGPRRAGHRHPGLVAARRRPRLRARRRRVPRPADRSGHHRPGGQVRQDPGAGRPALAPRARLLRDPEVGQAAPHRRELRRLRLHADRRGGRGDRRAGQGRARRPGPRAAQPRDVPEGRRQLLGAPWTTARSDAPASRSRSSASAR